MSQNQPPVNGAPEPQDPGQATQPPAPQAPQYSAPQQPQYPAQQQYPAPQQQQYAQQQYAQPQQPYVAAQPAYAPAPPTNTLAIIALVGAFFISLVGVICGHIALKQIARSGEGGRGLALAGLIIGYVGIAVWVIIIVFYVFIIGVAISANSY
ncbi:DUF4190 domain-containing protein [Leucobacter triazinivorans]|uniref:DUF4190 domain-containing protein n=1 Tax=Leucobacter triazinivorans TaxID=1784719 RepID=A0A4P6KCX9_9MICO|nr:DUF4190 domain-containing protein [Leucobacter triazinivorans]QBE48052.1 DUF4190 domain-containing protein [Leucobacter triazinivorans]